MRKVLGLLSLVALIFVSGCVAEKYEDGREKQEKKADDLMKNAEPE